MSDPAYLRRAFTSLVFVGLSGVAFPGQAQPEPGTSAPTAEPTSATGTGAAPLPPPPAPSEETEGTAFRQRFVLDTGRELPGPPRPEHLRFHVRGQYQARYTRLTDTPLFPTGDGPSSLGQTSRVTHWLRLTPRLQLGTELELVGQIDAVRGFFVGPLTRDVEPADPAYDRRNPIEVDPRWLYVEWRPASVGLFRLGQQPSHWGLGILANDGDHPSLFGDYREGSIVERVLYAGKPGGRGSPLTIALAGDLVFQDNLAELTDGDMAFQGVAAVTLSDRDPNPFVDHPTRSIGAYVVVRHQQRDAEGGRGTFDETIDVVGVNSAGQFDARLPAGDGHIFGGYELTYLTGSTNFTRTLDQVRNNEREEISSWGAAVQLGAALTDGDPAATDPARAGEAAADPRWGRLVAMLEWGWASGDADPADGVSRRFTFDPNHNVGLVLFDELMAWKTARAAATAEDPNLLGRPAPGADVLPSNGGIFGATYFNPTIVYRPVAELDLAAGLVVAQSTADMVDPVKVSTTGRYLNYDGGNPTSRDLGIEFDAGIEYRLSLNHDMTLQLGAQGGVLLPGRAFADAQGRRLGTQALGQGRLGLQF